MKGKILFVNSSLTAGGSEKVMTILANEFSKANYDVTMILIKSTAKENYKLDNNIKCVRFKYKYKNKIFKYIERVKKIRKSIKENKYDYIISFMYGINTSTLLASIGTGIPVIVSERCDPASRKLNKLIRKIEDRLYKRAKTIVLQTEQVKKQYPNYLQEKFVVIPNPISDEIIQPFKGEREHKIVAVGRLSSQKNFEMLIDAFKEISEEYSDYKLIIYGEGPLRNKLSEKIEYLNLTNKVELPGYVDNVNELMNNAKIYVSSSNFEGISNSMLESLAMGIPTICTNCPVGGAEMFIDDHENGILIPVGDCKELVKSIREILANEDLEKKLSNNAISVREQLNSKKIFKRWEELIKKK